MKGLLPFLIFLLKVFEAASSNIGRSEIGGKRLSREVEGRDDDDFVISEELKPRKSSRKNSESGFSEVPREEIFKYFYNFDQEKIDSIINSGYEVIEEGIWNDLIAARRYDAIKYMLMNHYFTEEFHRSTFNTAIVDGSTSLALFLLEFSRDFLIPSSKTSLSLAVQYERYKILKGMNRAGFDVNFVSDASSGRHLIHSAVEDDNVRLVKSLIKFSGLEINGTDIGGNTPLHHVKSVEMADILIKSGADPMSGNLFRIKPVQFASQYKNYELVKVLVPDLHSRLNIFLAHCQHIHLDQSCKLKIDRQNVLEDSFYLADQIEEWYDAHSEFAISFTGESGIDMGGLNREWMSLLIERFFVPRFPSEEIAETEVDESDGPSDLISVEDSDDGEDDNEAINEENMDMASGNDEGESDNDEDSESDNEEDGESIDSRFSSDSDNESTESSDDSTNSTDIFDVPAEFKIAYFGAPFECVDIENKLYTISAKYSGPLRIYKFIGSVLAKAFIKKIPLKVKLVPSIMKLIMGKTLTFEDLKDDDPVMFRSMSECLEPDFDFSGSQYVLPSDEGVFVDSENILEFLNETAVHSMYYRSSEQINELIIGFRSISILEPENLGTYFSVEELGKILLGEVNIDRSDLRSVFDIRTGYWKNNSEMFWSALDTLETWELIELVRFITGINGLPYGGFKALGRKLVVFDHIADQYVHSSTCNYHLSLPVSIQSVESLVESLRIALASTPEFLDGGCC